MPWRNSFKKHWPYYVLLILGAIIFLCVWMQRDGMEAQHLRSIERFHKGGKASTPEHYVAVWVPKVALVNSLLCLALIVAGPWILRPAQGARAGASVNVHPGGSTRLLWIVTLAAIVTSAALNFPRLGQSLWGDEEATMRRCVVGEYMPDAQGAQRWQGVSWTQCIFYYRDPNNHPFFSVLAKLSHSVFPPNGDPQGFYFNEAAIRLPAYLFGLGGLAAVAWLAATLGLPRAGIAAVILLGLHPWHVRYGVDARGYALLFSLIPLTLVFLAKAARTGAWRWWFCFGIGEFLTLWAYPGSLHTVVAINLAALAMIFLISHPRSWRWMQFRRYLAASVIGAMLSAQMLAPCVQPMLLYLKRGRISGELTANWYHDSFSQLFTGIPWHAVGNQPLILTWSAALGSHPVLIWILFSVLGLCLAAGLLRLFQLGGLHRCLLAAIVLPAPLMIAGAIAGGNILYPWYLMLALPGIALALGTGLDFLAAWLAARCRHPFVGWAAIAACLAGFGFAVREENHLLRTHSVEPNRESVCAMRPVRNPFTADLSGVMTIEFVMHTRGYDPMAVHVENAAELRAQLGKADAQGVPCFVHYADRGLAMAHHADIITELEQSGQFEALAPFYGMYPPSTRYVYRYKGVSAPPN